MVHLYSAKTAPPSDALLFIKVQFDMMLFSPEISIAPESFLAELSINLQFEMVVCFSNRMAPPSLDALLFIKEQSEMVHLFLVTTAPPSDALLFIKVQFDIMLFSPTIWIAPESFPAELSINLQFETVVCFSNRMAPPLDALLFQIVSL